MADEPGLKVLATNSKVEIRNFPKKIEIKEKSNVLKVHHTPEKVLARELTREIIRANDIGPQGPAGDPAPAFTTFVYSAPTASTSWRIVHNLNCFPAVSVVDSAGTQFFADVTYVDINTVEVNFAYATAGTAYLN